MRQEIFLVRRERFSSTKVIIVVVSLLYVLQFTQLMTNY